VESPRLSLETPRDWVATWADCQIYFLANEPFADNHFREAYIDFIPHFSYVDEKG
jgi:hypothetical protein